ncbi:MAG: endonuclease domain-containing protein [Ruminococcus sp.]|nr:endonuclease domain-containing protein [Ruminococcus sp.]
MKVPRNKNMLPNAKNLRKSMTPQERHLWYDFLRNYSVKFRRQEIIGTYIVDFYSHKIKLAIELDGSQHYEENGLEYDKKRTDFLSKLGVKVLRFSNLDINENFYGVCTYIDEYVQNCLKNTPQSAIADSSPNRGV